MLAYLGDVTVAPITRTIRDVPSKVALGPDAGVPQACVINLDHVQTVSKNRLGGIIATLPSSRTGEIREALLFALGY